MSIFASKDSLRRKYMAVMVLSAGCWGLGTVMSKGALGQLSPLLLLNVQLIASVTFLWIMTAFQYYRNPSKIQSKQPWKILRFSVSGFLEPGFAYTLGHMGLAMTTASNAALISAIEPVIITGLAGLLLKESVGIPLLALSMIAIAGVLLTVGFDPHLSSASVIGDSLIVLGTLCAALYVILSRRGVEKLEPLPLAVMQQSIGLSWIMLMCFVLEQTKDIQRVSVSPTVWGLAIVSGIIQFSLAFWLYLIALKGIPASLAAQFLTLIPIFGVCGAYLFLGEQLTMAQGLGMFLTVSAVYGMTHLEADRNKVN
jgi:drug/metabolite transporter (DMT)-like permease